LQGFNPTERETVLAILNPLINEPIEKRYPEHLASRYSFQQPGHYTEDGTPDSGGVQPNSGW